MISDRLVAIARCPDCGADLSRQGSTVTCAGCTRRFDASGEFLDLSPAQSFAEQTKYLDEALHADDRHKAIAPPVLGSKIRNDMLRRFLDIRPGDLIVDLGCGSGRTIAWNTPLGASIVGVDVSPHFASEALATADLLLGDLRRLPLKSATFDKAWSLDVLEHLSPPAFREVLTEARRVLKDDGRLFIYTHVRQNGWLAGGVRSVNTLARLGERLGLIDLRQERLRKSDHLNPIADHDELRRVVAECGLRIERITYYTPIVGAFVENVLTRMAERWLTRRASRRSGQSGEAAIRTARTSAQERVRRRGLTYRLLLAASAAMRLDVMLFGRIQSGPFFALLSRVPQEERGARPQQAQAS
jgi:SAM-dependent methyltransferase